MFISFGFTSTCNDVPSINQQIKKFVKSKLNKTVGAGQCWDLAAEALNSCKAKWDNNYMFGNLVDPKKECVFAGDIIQFEGVELQYKTEKTTYTEILEHHTAIIYEVKDKGSYVIADQNTKFTGKKVGLHDLKLNTLTKGTIKFYRPTN